MTAPSQSTLAYANGHRPWELYQQVFVQLFERCRVQVVEKRKFRTASVHAAAWKRMFDDFLSRYAARQGVFFQPFEIETDYRLYVDGKPRPDGLRSFLGSKGIELPEGRPEDSSGTEIIHGLGKRKNEDFLKEI